MKKTRLINLLIITILTPSFFLKANTSDANPEAEPAKTEVLTTLKTSVPDRTEATETEPPPLPDATDEQLVAPLIPESENFSVETLDTTISEENLLIDEADTLDNTTQESELIKGRELTSNEELNEALSAGNVVINNQVVQLDIDTNTIDSSPTKKTADGDPNFSLAFIAAVSYEPLESATTMMRDYGYSLDENLSTIETKIFYNNDSDDLIITYRGSQTKEDWAISDTALASGNLKKTPRYKRSENITNKARKKYKNAGRISLFGHSLGGALASELGNYKGSHDNVVTYNKGVGVKNFSPFTKSNPNETAYRINGDIISLLAKFDNNTKAYKASSSNFDPIGKHSDTNKAEKIPFFRTQQSQNTNEKHKNKKQHKNKLRKKIKNFFKI